MLLTRVRAYKDTRDALFQFFFFSSSFFRAPGGIMNRRYGGITRSRNYDSRGRGTAFDVVNDVKKLRSRRAKYREPRAAKFRAGRVTYVLL